MTVPYLYIMQKAIVFGTSSWNYIYVSEGPRTQPLLRFFTANKLSLLDGTYPRTFLVSRYYDCAVWETTISLIFKDIYPVSFVGIKLSHYGITQEKKSFVKMSKTCWFSLKNYLLFKIILYVI